MVREILIKDEYVPELIEVFSANYLEVIFDEDNQEIANPQSRAVFASEEFDRFIKYSIKRHVQRYRKNVAVSQINQEEITEKK